MILFFFTDSRLAFKNIESGRKALKAWNTDIKMQISTSKSLKFVAFL